MIGLIIRFNNWSTNIFQQLFLDIDYSNWFFKINYWESYGDEFENINHTITSDFFKKNIINNKRSIYPEFCELFISYKKNIKQECSTYKDFLNSKYYMAINIIDHRNIEICCKDDELLQKIKNNISKSNLENKQIIKINEIDYDANLSIFRGNDKSII